MKKKKKKKTIKLCFVYVVIKLIWTIETHLTTFTVKWTLTVQESHKHFCHINKILTIHKSGRLKLNITNLFNKGISEIIDELSKIASDPNTMPCFEGCSSQVKVEKILLYFLCSRSWLMDDSFDMMHLVSTVFKVWWYLVVSQYTLNIG